MALQNYRVYIALSLAAIGLQVFTTAAEARLYTGVVTRVTDGDTFWVRTSAHGSRWMVVNGHAWSYHYRRNLGPYATEETQARASGRGLWSRAAIEPREFRKRHGACPRAGRPDRASAA